MAMLAWICAPAAIGKYTVSHFGVENGLSNNHVVSITQDKHGLLWIATDEGLNRFDGHTFRTYYKDAASGVGALTGNELNALLDDPVRPILWIATARGGLDAYNYETDTFTSYRHDDNDPSTLVTDDVTSLSAASDGGIWISTFWRGFDHLDPDTGKFTHYSHENLKGLPHAPVWAVAEGPGRLLYLGLGGSGFAVADLSTATVECFSASPGNEGSLPSNDVESVFLDKMGNVWVGSKGGLSLFNAEKGTFTNLGDRHPELRHAVSDIRQFDDGHLWVAMERGGIAVVQFDDSVYSSPERIECRVIGDGQLSSPSVRSLFQDSHSNVWAGTWGGGMDMLSHNLPAFRTHQVSQEVRVGSIGSKSVLSLLSDSSGRLWIGKDSGGLYMQPEGSREMKFFSLPGGNGPEGVVQSSFQSRDGSLWFGLFYGGACRYEEAGQKFRQIFPKGALPDVRDITEDESGNLIFGTSAGVWRYNPRSGELEGSFAVGNNLVRKVYPLPSGNYLVGTFGDGLVLTDGDFKELSRLDVASGFPSNTVNDVFRSRNGHIWVATGEGLVDFKDIESAPEERTLYNRQSGLGNAHVLAIAQDRSGAIWISTNGGISCLKEGKVYNYTSRDHVPTGNFLGHSVATDSSGNIYFGSISGLCYFNPVKVLEKVTLPKPMVVELAVPEGGDSVTAGMLRIPVAGKGEVRLKPGQNSFEVSFATENFAMSREVEYAYMLRGYDDRWMLARDHNYVSFRDVKAGKYEFQVKTRVRNQEWSDPVSLKIVIPPPFYLSWWAKVIYVVAALGMAWALLYLYSRRVTAEAQLQAEKEQHSKEQELNDERLRFYTNITHELRTPLTLIMGPLEDVAKDKNLSQKDRRSLQMVHRNAARLLDLVNKLLEFRKTETHNRRLCVRRGNIAATVFEVALKYKELNRNPKVRVNVTTQSGDMEAVYDKEVVTMIVDNLMSNAMKYTPQGEVSVHCREEKGHMEISVRDTGIGISADVLPRVFERYYQEQGPHQAAGTGIGLALVKNLVALHHGVIEVRSGRDGTEFFVTLPAGDTYPEALHPEEPHVAADMAEPAPQEMPESDDRKPLVLMVEDNADIRDYVKQAFTDLYDVRTAENGREGLDMAREIMPAVIVSDIMMPVMDGIEMTRELKGDLRTSHIPIILLTAKGAPGDREEGYASGADSYLVKPFSSSLLQTRINNLLLQRMKLREKFSSPSVPAIAPEGDSLERKREKLMKSLNEVDKKFIERLTKTISDNLPSENVDVNFLSGEFCMSSSTLYRKVKALTGLSPNEYIRKIKMQMAEELLLKGSLTFSEIAFKVGMNSVAYFRSCFKDEFGMTPTEYMKRISGEG